MTAHETATRRAETVVVGGGVIGLACALELLGAGRTVRVLEREEVGAGASRGNAGLVTPSHATPLTQPGMVRRVLGWMLDADAPIHVQLRPDLRLLAWAVRFALACGEQAMLRTMRARSALLQSSRELFDEWMASGAFDCEWEPNGLLLVFATAEALETEAALHGRLRQLGIHAVPLTRAELVGREPSLCDDLAGGVWFPQDAHLRPERLITDLARRVRELGGEIEEGCEALGFERSARRVTAVRTSRGDRAADDVVLATGAWSPRLGRPLGLRLPVQPGKGYSITLERPAVCPRLPMILEEAATGVTPWASGLRMAGTVEFSGFDDRPRPARFEAMRSAAARYLRVETEGLPAREWFGWRAMTPDELPIIGRAARLENAFVATGHGRMGVSMAPGTAKLVVELLTGEQPHLDPAPYAPERFGGSAAP